MNAAVNNVILTPKVSKALAKLQYDGVDMFCRTLDDVIGLIIDLKTDSEVDSNTILGAIGDIRYLASSLRELIPEKELEEGGMS